MSSDAGAGESAAGPPDRTDGTPEYLIVGHISKPHGTKGELFVWPLTDHPEQIFAPGQSLLLGNDEGALPRDAPSVVIESARAFKRGLLVRLQGVESREAVEAMARRYLLVPGGAVTPLDADEVFYHELLGMAVETVAGDSIGRVREVFEAVPADLLEVVDGGGAVRLVPFAERIVREVDRAGRRLVIDPPEGLLDL